MRSESSSGKIYFPLNLVDFGDMYGTVISYEWRKDVPSGTWLDLEHLPVEILQNIDVKEEFKRFFINEGNVLWQWEVAQIDV